MVHGLEATGKSSVIRALLRAIGVGHAIVKCQECITARHLFEVTVAAVEDALVENSAEEQPSGLLASSPERCESLSGLVAQLRRLLLPAEELIIKFVLVLDGIDRQREGTPTLFPALARLGEIVRPHHSCLNENLMACGLTVYMMCYPTDPESGRSSHRHGSSSRDLPSSRDPICAFSELYQRPSRHDPISPSPSHLRTRIFHRNTSITAINTFSASGRG